MKITRKSIYSGVTRTLELDCTEEQLQQWQDGELIQNALPGLSLDEREFLKTGMTPQEWDELELMKGDSNDE